MSLDLDELKKLHDKAYDSNTVTRERVADDMIFYWVTQWDDNLLGDSQLAYRGEFNILRKAGRQIISDLRSNPIQIDFEPKAESRQDGADLIDGLYLSDDRLNSSKEAYDNASMEAVVGGVGAWELYTEYETNRVGNDNQVIRRRPVYEANDNCFWDPNAQAQDKSDADYVSILKRYSEDGYIDLVKELTGEEISGVNGSVMESFKIPQESFTFPWAAGANMHIYVTCFYHREKVKDTVLNMLDPLGNPLSLMESQIEDVRDDLMKGGYTIESKKEIERWEITKYIASGEKILKEYSIAGENIPVIPIYGERAFVEGEEVYEGITKLAKDPQRLRNFQMSYLADIVSRSPRTKPMFNPEQIQGFENMYNEAGADNNYPYLLQNRFDAAGQPLAQGPVGIMPEQPMPQALIASMELSRQAVEDVANPGIPNEIAETDISGKAVNAIQNRLDQQSMIYQENLKHAKRRDGEIYAAMATQVYDAPRSVTLTLPDGSRKTEQLMSIVQDAETGEMVVLNDLTNMEFEVFGTIGDSYASKKEQNIAHLENMAMATQNDPEMNKIIMLTLATMIDGARMADIREYANKQLLIMGVRKPQSEEDMQILQQAQENQQPDAATLMAQAEQAKADASMADTQRKATADQFSAQNEMAKRQIDQFRAQTDRAAIEVDAEEAGANIEFTRIKTQGQQIDNVVKLTEPFRAKAS